MGTTVKVRVENEDGQFAEGTLTYKYPPPVITGMSPTELDPTGGTTVTITGSGFMSTTKVYIGGKPAGMVSSAPTQLVVIAPAE